MSEIIDPAALKFSQQRATGLEGKLFLRGPSGDDAPGFRTFTVHQNTHIGPFRCSESDNPFFNGAEVKAEIVTLKFAGDLVLKGAQTPEGAAIGLTHDGTEISRLEGILITHQLAHAI